MDLHSPLLTLNVFKPKKIHKEAKRLLCWVEEGHHTVYLDLDSTVWSLSFDKNKVDLCPFSSDI